MKEFFKKFWEANKKKDKTEEIVEEKVEVKAEKPAKAKKEEAPFMYKDYDIKWLKKVGGEHPEFGLVAEYEDKYGEIK